MNIFFYFNHKINHVFFFFCFYDSRKQNPEKKLPDETLNFQYEISHSHLKVIKRKKLIRKQSGLSDKNIPITKIVQFSCEK